MELNNSLPLDDQAKESDNWNKEESTRKKILLVNDDGIEAPGIITLLQCLNKYSNKYVLMIYIVVMMFQMQGMKLG
jgi:hypothetical protein